MITGIYKPRKYLTAMNDYPKKVKLLSVGVAHSAIAGKCAGADSDATNMFAALKEASNPGYAKLLVSADATVENVERELREICRDNDGLAIFFYAGHGGSQKVKVSAEEETDGKDEYIILYDGCMIDDKIWNIVATATCRVFLVFDCCHSETMFRFSPAVIDASREKSWFARLIDRLQGWLARIEERFEAKTREAAYLNKQPAFSELLCWSGCADDKVSYGSPTGGLFTSTILAYMKNNKTLTYDAFWDRISKDVRLRSREVSKRTLLKAHPEAGSFDGKAVFT